MSVKLRPPYDEVLDLTELSWARDVAKDFADAIPIITDMPKGKSTTSIHFRDTTETYEMAEKLVYRRTGFFDTPSESLRAALHIGLSILWEMFDGKGVECETARSMKERWKAREKLDALTAEIRHFIKDVDTHYKAADLGIISHKDRDIAIDAIISKMPKAVQGVARERLKRYEAGEKVTELHEARGHGGDRKIGKPASSATAGE